jgi:hypothetical protein
MKRATLKRRPATDLAAHAARLYPDSPFLQAEWMRAVRTVRASSKGWLLDQPGERAHAKQ